MTERSFDRPPGNGELIHQHINRVIGMGFGVGGQTGVSARGEDVGMAENFLHLLKTNPGFDQMGGIAVTQTVRADLFFNPQLAATFFIATCTPPRSSGESAFMHPLRPRLRLGNNNVG